MKISKRVRNYIKPAVLYGWKMEQYGNRWFWDGDNTMPVGVGAMTDKLINEGLLEKVQGVDWIRATPLAERFRCTSHCQYGKLYADDGEYVGDCPECDGAGMMLEINT